VAKLSEINIEVESSVSKELSKAKDAIRQMESEMAPDFEKTLEGIRGFAASITLTIGPAIAAMETVAMQLAASLEPVMNAFNNLTLEVDWEKIVISMTLENPERWPYESLSDWGNRLERAGLFDCYETRLMYGAECWRAVLHSPVWYAGEAWDWVYNDSEWVWLDVKERVRGLWTKT
jgi:hypothetical protein